MRRAARIAQRAGITAGTAVAGGVNAAAPRVANAKTTAATRSDVSLTATHHHGTSGKSLGSSQASAGMLAPHSVVAGGRKSGSA